jgi:prepilin-type N-terminal cleavage/methylation domain-containing protein
MVQATHCQLLNVLKIAQPRLIEHSGLTPRLIDTIPGEYVMTTCKQPKPSEKLPTVLSNHQGFKPLAHGSSRLKTTELLSHSLLKRTLTMRQRLKSLANEPLDGMTQVGGFSNPPSTPLNKLEGANQTKIDGAENLTPSPDRRGLGRGYLYLLQKSILAKSSGFTIVECLLAIILVGILMTAIAPVVVLSVATRVQARRVEQATMAGRSYIDAVQSGTVKPPGLTVLLNENPSGTYTSDRNNFALSIAAPISTPINCPDDRATNPNSSYPYCAPARPNLYCVDNDGGGCTSGSPRDYIVQPFRSVVTLELDTDGTLKDKGTEGYVLGVRVYRADAFDGTNTLQTTKGNYDNKVATKVATYAGGKGNQFAPLAEFTTEIRPQAGDPGAAMKNLCDRLGGCKNTTTP